MAPAARVDLDRINLAGRVNIRYSRAFVSIDREPPLSSDAAIPSAVHRPVLLDEVLDALEPRLGGVIIDGTTGAGGGGISNL